MRHVIKQSVNYDNSVHNITGINFPNKTSFSDEGRYWRQIGGGLFSEWMNLVDYGLNINPNRYYWTGKHLKQQSPILLLDEPFSALDQVCSEFNLTLIKFIFINKFSASYLATLAMC